MTTTPSRFNIRVYGLYVEPPSGTVLVCDEVRFGKKFTKFPGGGLEFGEGVLDALRREWKEETGLELQNPKLFYVNDFLQRSAFNPDDQILSIYYTIECIDISKLSLKEKRFDFDRIEEGSILFRKVPMDETLTAQLSFPIDQIVADKLVHLTGNRKAH